MKASIILALAAAVAAAPAMPVGAAPPSESASVTHVIGNPRADARLVEYVSYTCSHCADFERKAGDYMKLVYVADKGMAIEIRHVVRDPVDLTAALLAHCGDADRFAANHRALLLSQQDWMGAIQQTTVAQRARYQTGSYASRNRAIALDAGLYDLMKKRGYSRVQVDRCLENDVLARALASATRDYADAGVKGTPSFALDGELLDGVHGWETLQPVLDARLKG